MCVCYINREGCVCVKKNMGSGPGCGTAVFPVRGSQASQSLQLGPVVLSHSDPSCAMLRVLPVPRQASLCPAWTRSLVPAPQGGARERLGLRLPRLWVRGPGRRAPLPSPRTQHPSSPPLCFFSEKLQSESENRIGGTGPSALPRERGAHARALWTGGTVSAGARVQRCSRDLSGALLPSARTTGVNGNRGRCSQLSATQSLRPEQDVTTGQCCGLAWGGWSWSG